MRREVNKDPAGILHLDIRTALLLCLIVCLWMAVTAAAENTETAEAVTEAWQAEETESGTEYGTGLERSSGGGQVCTFQEMQDQYGMREENGIYLFTPTDPKPLNVFVFAHPDSEIGINMDGIHVLDEVDNSVISDRILSNWSYALSLASHDALQFVFDPNDADVLLIAKHSYPFYATYSSAGGSRADGYCCSVDLTAVQLTNPENVFSVSETNTPGDTVTTNGGSKFWEPVPELEDQLPSLAEAIMGWYGYGAEQGSSGSGVRTAQQSMIDRGFLSGNADGSFGPMTKEAVERVQDYYGLERTGSIDRDTLVAIYYNKDAVDGLPDIQPDTEGSDD